MSIKPENSFEGPPAITNLLPKIKSTWALFKWEANNAAVNGSRTSARLSSLAAKKLEKLLQEWRRVSIKEIG